jgi:hypothetical protein
MFQMNHLGVLTPLITFLDINSYKNILLCNKFLKSVDNRIEWAKKWPGKTIPPNPKRACLLLHLTHRISPVNILLEQTTRKKLERVLQYYMFIFDKSILRDILNRYGEEANIHEIPLKYRLISKHRIRNMCKQRRIAVY